MSNFFILLIFFISLIGCTDNSGTKRLSSAAITIQDAKDVEKTDEKTDDNQNNDIDADSDGSKENDVPRRNISFNSEGEDGQSSVDVQVQIAFEGKSHLFTTAKINILSVEFTGTNESEIVETSVSLDGCGTEQEQWQAYNASLEVTIVNENAATPYYIKFKNKNQAVSGCVPDIVLVHDNIAPELKTFADTVEFKTKYMASDRVVASWEEAVEAGSGLRSYEVDIIDAESGASIHNEEVASHSVSMECSQIMGAAVGKKYKLAVKAVDKAGNTSNSLQSIEFEMEPSTNNSPIAVAEAADPLDQVFPAYSEQSYHLVFASNFKPSEQLLQRRCVKQPTSNFEQIVISDGLFDPCTDHPDVQFTTPLHQIKDTEEFCITTSNSGSGIFVINKEKCAVTQDTVQNKFYAFSAQKPSAVRYCSIAEKNGGTGYKLVQDDTICTEVENGGVHADVWISGGADFWAYPDSSLNLSKFCFGNSIDSRSNLVAGDNAVCATSDFLFDPNDKEKGGEFFAAKAPLTAEKYFCVGQKTDANVSLLRVAKEEASCTSDGFAMLEFFYAFEKHFLGTNEYCVGSNALSGNYIKNGNTCGSDHIFSFFAFPESLDYAGNLIAKDFLIADSPAELLSAGYQYEGLNFALIKESTDATKDILDDAIELCKNNGKHFIAPICADFNMQRIGEPLGYTVKSSLGTPSEKYPMLVKCSNDNNGVIENRLGLRFSKDGEVKNCEDFKNQTDMGLVRNLAVVVSRYFDATNNQSMLANKEPTSPYVYDGEKYVLYKYKLSDSLLPLLQCLDEAAHSYSLSSSDCEEGKTKEILGYMLPATGSNIISECRRDLSQEKQLIFASSVCKTADLATQLGTPPFPIFQEFVSFSEKIKSKSALISELKGIRIEIEALDRTVFTNVNLMNIEVAAVEAIRSDIEVERDGVLSSSATETTIQENQSKATSKSNSANEHKNTAQSQMNEIEFYISKANLLAQSADSIKNILGTVDEDVMLDILLANNNILAVQSEIKTKVKNINDDINAINGYLAEIATALVNIPKTRAVRVHFHDWSGSDYDVDWWLATVYQTYPTDNQELRFYKSNQLNAGFYSVQRDVFTFDPVKHEIRYKDSLLCFHADNPDNGWVRWSACDGSSNQQWTWGNGQIMHQGKCVGSGDNILDGDWDRLVIWPCEDIRFDDEFNNTDKYFRMEGTWDIGSLSFTGLP